MKVFVTKNCSFYEGFQWSFYESFRWSFYSEFLSSTIPIKSNKNRRNLSKNPPSAPITETAHAAQLLPPTARVTRRLLVGHGVSSRTAGVIMGSQPLRHGSHELCMKAVELKHQQVWTTCWKAVLWGWEVVESVDGLGMFGWWTFFSLAFRRAQLTCEFGGSEPMCLVGLL